MLCPKTGGDCRFSERINNRLVFVLMPFKGFDSVWDAIQLAVSNVRKKKLKCERADTVYTNLNIWCRRVCMNIRKARYIIADTTGLNPNVFYELGYAHAISYLKTIIITQNINDAPFDVRDLNHIEYSEKHFASFREKVTSAIETLEEEYSEYQLLLGEHDLLKRQENSIGQLKKELLKEQKRSNSLQRKLENSVKREDNLREQLARLEFQRYKLY